MVASIPEFHQFLIYSCIQLGFVTYGFHNFDAQVSGLWGLYSRVAGLLFPDVSKEGIVFICKSLGVLLVLISP
jgi:hypothetical protein